MTSRLLRHLYRLRKENYAFCAGCGSGCICSDTVRAFVGSDGQLAQNLSGTKEELLEFLIPDIIDTFWQFKGKGAMCARSNLPYTWLAAPLGVSPWPDLELRCPPMSFVRDRGGAIRRKLRQIPLAFAETNETIPSTASQMVILLSWNRRSISQD